MKRNTSTLVMGLALSSACNTLALADPTITVQFNGTPMILAQPPVMINQSVLVPMRAIFQKMNASVQWIPATQEVRAMSADNSIFVDLFVGKTQAFVNNRPVTLLQAPVVISGSTMVPLRFVAESMGAEVMWDNRNSQVNIIYKGSTTNTGSPMGNGGPAANNGTGNNPITPPISGGITGFTDPALLQARQSYNTALQNLSSARQSVAPIAATQQAAADGVRRAQSRYNDAQGDYQGLVNQYGGDEDSLRRRQEELKSDLERARNEIPTLQNSTIPSLSQQLNDLNSSLTPAQAQIVVSQSKLDQANSKVNKANQIVTQDYANLQSQQAIDDNDRAAVSAAQRADDQAAGDINAAQAQLTNATSTQNRLATQLNGINADIASKQAEIKQDQDAIAADNANIQTLSQVKPSDPAYGQDQIQIRKLRADIEAINRKMGVDINWVSADQTNANKVSSQLNAAQNEVAQDTIRLASAKQSKSAADQQLKAAQATLAQQDQAMAPAKAVLAQDLNTLSDAQARQKSAQEELNAANDRLRRINDQIGDTSRQLEAANRALREDLDIQKEGPRRIADLEEKRNRLRESGERVARAGRDLNEAQTTLQTAQVNLDSANNQLSIASNLAQSSAAQLNTVCSEEPIAYLAGAGGIGMDEAYSNTLREITPALTGGPGNYNAGLTIYAPGVSILWGSQNGSYVGSEAIILRSASSPSSAASNLQGYAGSLNVPAYGTNPALSLTVGSTVTMPAGENLVGSTFINQLFNGLEPQGGFTTGSVIDCLATSPAPLCQVQYSGSNIVLILPNSILVLAPSGVGFTVQTIALLNTSVLGVTQDMSTVLSTVIAQ